MHWYAENKNVFNKHLKLSVVRSGSRRLSGKVPGRRASDGKSLAVVRAETVTRYDQKTSTG